MLPPEPVVLLARQDFADAQAAMAGTPSLLGIYPVGWYGANVDDDRGSFAIVNGFGPLADYVGDYVSVRHKNRSVLAYVIGSQTAMPDQLALTRRCFMAIALLSSDPINAEVFLVS